MGWVNEAGHGLDIPIVHHPARLDAWLGQFDAAFADHCHHQFGFDRAIPSRLGEEGIPARFRG
jgi:hypothetical protein